jgi:hypothetical protein
VPYRIRAHNAATSSENKIHDDDVARRYGFTGGLVPGVTVFGYLSRPVVDSWGLEWLERGTMTARFRRPVYEGDVLTVSAAGEGEALELAATNEDGVVCAVATATLPSDPVAAPPVGDYPVAPLPEARVPATPEALRTLDVLGSVEAEARPEEPGEAAHPAWLLLHANRVLAANVALGPWIHAASAVTCFGSVLGGEVVCTRARVAGLSERRGNQLVDLDVLVVAPGDRPVLHARHLAIYRLSPSGRAPSR